MPEQSTSLNAESDKQVGLAGAVRCIDCGYDLQATPEDGACPECGLAVATSVNKSGSATLRSFFVLVCRLYSVWLIVVSIQHLVAMVLMLIYWDRSRGNARMGADVFEILFPVLLPLVLNGVGVVVVWCFSPWLARRAIRRDRPLALGAGMRALDGYCVGLCLMGVWLCVNAILDFNFYVARGFEESRQYAADQFGTKVTTQEWFGVLASTAAGVLLIHYGRRRLPVWPGAGTLGEGRAEADASKG